jgi:hypothetical protein
MATLHHIYVTAHGEWNTPAWTGEKGQIGIRLPITEGADEPDKGSVFTPIENGDIVLDSGTTAGVNGTLTRTWAARLGPLASTDNADAGMQADLADDFWTYLNAIKAYHSNYWRWTHVKIAPIVAGGAYGAPSAVYQFTSPITGTGASPTAPPEVAIAVSLRAGIIGRRGRGRFYLPGLSSAATVSGDGTVQSACATALVSATTTLVSNLQDMPGTEDYGPTVAVMSAGSTTAVRPTEVRVGNHFDAQRRRQHQVAESYTKGTL